MDYKSSIRFYLDNFFGLIDVACAETFISAKNMDLNELILLDFKSIVSAYPIGRYRNRAPPKNKTRSKRKYLYQYELSTCQPPPKISARLQAIRTFLQRRLWQKKTYIRCPKCGILFCLVRETNFLLKHHS